MSKRPRLAFLASNNGTSMQNIIAAIRANEIAAEPVLLISNKADSGAMDFARRAGIAARHISRKTHPDDAARDTEMAAALRAADTDLVILSGYLQKIGPAVIAAFAPNIINIHPALLPDFGGAGMYGRHVHEAVLAAGHGQSGASIHIVDGEYDRGPVIAQNCVPVLSGDTVETLSARVEAAEKALMIETVGKITKGQIRLSDLRSSGAH